MNCACWSRPARVRCYVSLFQSGRATFQTLFDQEAGVFQTSVLLLFRLTAADIALPVEVYDPDAYYQAVRNRWFGLTAPGE